VTELIIVVPAAEIALHPHDQSNRNEMYLVCFGINAQVAALQKKGV
jgi:hypothetical protein